MAPTEQVCSQGSESNNGWCSVAVPSFLPTYEVLGVTSGVYSQTPSGGRPFLPLVSEITAVALPSTNRSYKSQCIALSPPLPLAHTRGAQPPVAHIRIAQFPIA